MEKYPEATMRGDKIHFYPIGIYASNTTIKLKRRMCEVKTLGSLRKQFQEEEVSLTFLRQDESPNSPPFEPFKHFLFV